MAGSRLIALRSSAKLPVACWRIVRCWFHMRYGEGDLAMLVAKWSCQNHTSRSSTIRCGVPMRSIHENIGSMIWARCVPASKVAGTGSSASGAAGGERSSARSIASDGLCSPASTLGWVPIDSRRITCEMRSRSETSAAMGPSVQRRCEDSMTRRSGARQETVRTDEAPCDREAPRPCS
jgi:hypothetical protein